MPNSPSHRCSKLTLIHDPEYSTISIEGIVSSQEEKLFEGTIKNKSELKKLMIQLGIKQLEKNDKNNLENEK